jgi:hypothetical protein
MQARFEMKLQAIRSKGRPARLFVNVPLALAAALDMQPGERLRWQLLNRSDLRLIRLAHLLQLRANCFRKGAKNMGVLSA